MSNSIKFKYHPNVLSNKIVMHEKGVCEVCGDEVEVYTDHIYAIDDAECICLECVSNGEAAEHFDGSFNDLLNPLDDDEKNEILAKRTPGISSWQEIEWVKCCNDYCQYIENVGTKELEEKGLLELLDEFPQVIKDNMHKDGDCTGHLFYCPICSKHYLVNDAS